MDERWERRDEETAYLLAGPDAHPQRESSSETTAPECSTTRKVVLA